MLQHADTTRSACIVTFTDESMLPGTQVLIHSLLKHNDLSDVPIIVLSDDPRNLDDPLIRDHSEQRRVVDLGLYAGIGHTQHRLGLKSYAAAFEAFRDYGCTVNLYLDADMLCMGSIDELLRPTDYDLRVVADGADNVRRMLCKDFTEFNSGMMAIGRRLHGDAVVEHLIHRAMTLNSYDAGDQGILNQWVVELGLNVEHLSAIYNLLKMVISKRRADWPWRCKRELLDDCRLLHFVWHKPWHRSDKHFEPLDRLWRAAYTEIHPEQAHSQLQEQLT